MKKIFLRIIHVSDSGEESIMYQEDIGESIYSSQLKVLNKAFELAKTVQNASVEVTK